MTLRARLEARLGPGIKPGAVLWDLDNTLIDRDSAAAAVFREASLSPERQAKLAELDDHGRGDRESLFQAWRSHTGQPLDQAGWARALCRHLQPDLQLISDLQELSLDYKMAIVTNGGGETQRAKIRAAGLDRVFSPELIFISGERGWSKPDPRLFQLACNRLNVAPSCAVMVGDQLETDGKGAEAAGLSFVLAGQL